MTVIGLTGGIASGKSTAAAWLLSFGANVIDADRLGHRVYEPGSPGFQAVVNAFGHDIVAADGTINRPLLGGKVFGDPAQMTRLTDIVWPEIRRLGAQEIADLKRREPDKHIVLEAAVLVEAQWFDLVDQVWVVTVSPEVARDRLMSRNNLSEAQAQSRIDAQISNQERLEYAYVHIDNSGTLDQFREAVEAQWTKLTGKPAPASKASSKAAKAAAKPAAKAAAKPAAKAAAKPAAKTAAKPAAKTAAKSAAKTAAKPAAKAAAKPAAKATAKPAAKADAKPVAKAAAKPAAKAAAKPTVKSAASKPAAKPVVKAAAKAAAKPVAKAAAKPAVKSAAAKPASKPVAKPVAKKPAAKPAAKKPVAKTSTAKTSTARPAASKAAKAMKPAPAARRGGRS